MHRKKLPRKKDRKAAEALLTEIVRLFPLCPKHLRNTLSKFGIKNTMRLHKADVSIKDKAIGAAIAYIRHYMTDYDALLEQGVPKKEARLLIKPRTHAVLAEWGYKHA